MDNYIKQHQNYNMSSAPAAPYIVIAEQPRSGELRFRYACEGRNAGTLKANNHSPKHPIYPTIQIENMPTNEAIVTVSCVTIESPYRQHPHNLTGTNCIDGVCKAFIQGSSISFTKLGIQCVKKKDVRKSLELRCKTSVDPFNQGFSEEITNLQSIRLCFQVTLPDNKGGFSHMLPPVVSDVIHDRKTLFPLRIERISRQSGSTCGGDEVFIFTNKIQKLSTGLKQYDIEVRFFEPEGDWEQLATFSQSDVHRQVALVIRTPAYYREDINNAITVYFQLRRPSDGETSDSKQFQYIPNDDDPDGIFHKRRKIHQENSVPYNSHRSSDESDLVKEKIRATVSRRNYNYAASNMNCYETQSIVQSPPLTPDNPMTPITTQMTPGTPHMNPSTPITPQSHTPQSMTPSPMSASVSLAAAPAQAPPTRTPQSIPSLTPQMIRPPPPIRDLIGSSMLLPSMSSRLTSELANIQYSGVVSNSVTQHGVGGGGGGGATNVQTTDGMLAAAFQKTVVEGVEDNWSLPDIATYSSETQRHLVEIEKLFNA